MCYGACLETQESAKQNTVVGNDLEEQLNHLKNENEELYDQFEQTITRANTLEVQAEIARLEFNQVFNAIDDAIWIIGNNKRVLRVNKALLNILNLKNEDEALGKECHELIHSDLCSSPKCPLNNSKKNSNALK